MRIIKILCVLSLLVLGFNVSHAQQRNLFYNEFLDGDWAVLGDPGNKDFNMSCGLEKIIRIDGVKTGFTLVQDLVDAEMYVMISNSQWNFTPVEGQSIFFFEFTKREVGTKRMSAHIMVLKPDLIVIPNIKIELFLPDFMNADFFRVLPSGAAPDVSVPLKGSKAAISSLQKCMKESNKVSSTKKSTDS